MARKLIARIYPGDERLEDLGVDETDREPLGYKFFVDDLDEVLIVDDEDLCEWCTVEYVLVDLEGDEVSVPTGPVIHREECESKQEEFRELVRKMPFNPSIKSLDA